MSATLRINRGSASPERVLYLGTEPLGRLDESVMDFDIPTGRHLVYLRIGPYHNVVTFVEARPDEVVELTVEDSPTVITPLAEGGYLRFHHEPREHLAN